MSYQKISSVLLFLSLSACNWVDSTGNQSESLPAFADPTLAILSDGDALRLDENTRKSVVFSDADNRATDWTWQRLDGQANIQRCSAFSDFDQNYAVNALPLSCESDEACELNFEETVNEGITSFALTTPHLKAPTALEYMVTAQTDNGARIERRQLVCAVPINDAPDAAEDRYTITRGTTLQVEGNSTSSLLANDEDDQDVRNQRLSVVTTPDIAPEFAANFQLFSDGGFIYEPTLDAPLASGSLVSDRFTYSITDGTGTSTATVKIRIIDFNTAPVQTSDLPEVQTFIFEQPEVFTYDDLNRYFSDAEDDALEFSSVAGTLPKSQNVVITSDGLLRGVPQGNDSGRYYVQLTASDSMEEVDASFFLNVTRTNGVNKAPYANDISNITVSDDFTYNITEFFEDADGDNMTFTATGLPDDVEISPYGIITGTVTSANAGRVVIRVIANDGHGGTNSDGFRLTLSE